MYGGKTAARTTLEIPNTKARPKIAVLQLSLSSGVLKVARGRMSWHEIKVELAGKGRTSLGSGTPRSGKLLTKKN